MAGSGIGSPPNRISWPVEEYLDRLVSDCPEGVLPPQAGSGERTREARLGEPSHLPALERMRLEHSSDRAELEDERVQRDLGEPDAQAIQHHYQSLRLDLDPGLLTDFLDGDLGSGVPDVGPAGRIQPDSGVAALDEEDLPLLVADDRSYGDLGRDVSRNARADCAEPLMDISCGVFVRARLTVVDQTTGSGSPDLASDVQYLLETLPFVEALREAEPSPGDCSQRLTPPHEVPGRGCVVGHSPDATPRAPRLGTAGAPQSGGGRLVRSDSCPRIRDHRAYHTRMPHRSPALIAAPPRAPGLLWLTNARLFDATSDESREDAAVLLKDGVIYDVKDASDRCPAGAQVLDLEGRTLMPGLIDVHVHDSGAEPEPLHGAEALLSGTPAHFLQAGLRDRLRQGVTTIRVVGSQAIRPQEARQAMRYGAFRGPRLLTCGKIISATAPGGRFYGDMYREADGPDDVRRAVREQIREGADFVKVMTTGARSNELEDPEPVQFTEAEFAALVDEAHRLGYKVAAHAEGVAGCEAAIRHEMDTIEHGMYLHTRPDLLAQMASRAQVLVPTLSGYYWMAGLGRAIDPNGVDAAGEMPEVLVDLAAHNLEQGALTMRAAKDLGVRIALGSDAHTTALEVLRMIHHGLSPAAALRAGTAVAAEAVGLGDEIGTIEEGKLADLLVVDGDVLSSPELLADEERVWLVLQLGTPVAGSALERPIAGQGTTSPGVGADALG